MSIKLMSCIWENFPRGGGEKLVLLALADWADDFGYRIYPSIAAVAKKTNLSERQVQRILNKFVDDGILEIVANENGGRNRTRHYHMNASAIKGDIMTPIEDIKGDICDIKGDTHVTRSIIEPLVEPLEPPDGAKAKILKRRSRIPDDWEIEEDDPNHLYAKSKGMTWAELEVEEEKFKNFHGAKGSVFADVNKAWRTWVTNWLTYRRGSYGKT